MLKGEIIMKKITEIVIAAVLAAFALFAIVFIVLTIFTYCSPSDKKLEKTSVPVTYYTDPETGVEYLISNTKGITPRLDAEGKVMVSTESGGN